MLPKHCALLHLSQRSLIRVFSVPKTDHSQTNKITVTKNPNEDKYCKNLALSLN